jgi:tRNA (guanine-N7-)-methyltransferase
VTGVDDETEQGKPVVPVSAIEVVPVDYFRPMEMAGLFPRAARLEMDLGCGDGSFLVSIAQRHPERNYIGTERLFGRVRTTSRKLERAAVKNVRLLRVESAYVVKHLMPPGSVTRFYILFPDPWPKRRHWNRRLIQPDFLEAAADALSPAGELCVKTDDAGYFQFIEKVAAACPRFSRTPWEEDVPRTDFERHYVAQGRPIHSLCLKLH